MSSSADRGVSARGPAGRPRLVRVAPAALPQAWPRIAQEIACAADLSEGRYRPEDIRRAIEVGAFGLWLVEEAGALAAVVLTELLEYPTGFRECVVWHVSGRGLRRWIGLRDELERWAAAMGCRAIGYRGREGWQRINGWARRAVWCERRL